MHLLLHERGGGQGSQSVCDIHGSFSECSQRKSGDVWFNGCRFNPGKLWRKRQVTLKGFDLSSLSDWKLQDRWLGKVPKLMTPSKRVQVPRCCLWPVDMLIGQDQIDLHLSRCDVKGNSGEPIARLGPLGLSCVGHPDRRFTARDPKNKSSLHPLLQTSGVWRNQRFIETILGSQNSGNPAVQARNHYYWGKDRVWKSESVSGPWWVALPSDRSVEIRLPLPTKQLWNSFQLVEKHRKAPFTTAFSWGAIQANNRLVSRKGLCSYG